MISPPTAVCQFSTSLFLPLSDLFLSTQISWDPLGVFSEVVSLWNTQNHTGCNMLDFSLGPLNHPSYRSADTARPDRKGCTAYISSSPSISVVCTQLFSFLVLLHLLIFSISSSEFFRNSCSWKVIWSLVWMMRALNCWIKWSQYGRKEQISHSAGQGTKLKKDSCNYPSKTDN